MEQLQFVSPYHQILTQKSRELSFDEVQKPSMQSWFDSMILFARGEQGDRNRSVLVGLAAPQIGKNIRVILVDTKADGKGNVADLHLYINPEITSFSKESEEWYEGCYSTGNVKGVVRRPVRIILTALNRYGQKVHEIHSGYVARIFQHEIDHLNGIRFPERMPKDAHVHVVKDNEMGLYRNEQQWKTWARTAPVCRWQEVIE